MTPQEQTIFKLPHGNCIQACFASILELPLESVPNFAVLCEGIDDWGKEMMVVFR